MKVGKLLRRVDISPAFTAFLCAYYYLDPAGTFWAFFGSILAHELGHLAALKAAGVRIHRLRLTASGASIRTEPMSYRQELLTAAAGPAVNVLLSCFFLHRVPAAALINLALLTYNLLPFYPLDGGRILRCLLHLLLKPHIAELLERCVEGVCLLLLWMGAIYLCCVLHEGLWPAVVCGLLTVRIAGTIFPAKGIFVNKRVDKSITAC